MYGLSWFVCVLVDIGTAGANGPWEYTHHEYSGPASGRNSRQSDVTCSNSCAKPLSGSAGGLHFKMTEIYTCNVPLLSFSVILSFPLGSIAPPSFDK